MADPNQEIEQDSKPETVEDSRREFLKRYGKYAAVTPVALTSLMAPGKASAACSQTALVSCTTTCRPNCRALNPISSGMRPAEIRQVIAARAQCIRRCISACFTLCRRGSL